MAGFLIRGVRQQTVRQLTVGARRAGRSLEGEIRLILEREARLLSIDEALERAKGIRETPSGRGFDDSADVLREDRER